MADHRCTPQLSTIAVKQIALFSSDTPIDFTVYPNSWY